MEPDQSGQEVVMDEAGTSGGGGGGGTAIPPFTQEGPMKFKKNSYTEFDKLATETLIEENILFFLPQIMPVFLWTKRIKDLFKTLLFNDNKIYSGWQLHSAGARVFNMIQYTRNNLGGGTQFNNTKNQSSYIVTGQINSKNCGGHTAQINGLRFDLNQLMENKDQSSYDPILSDFDIIYEPKDGINPANTPNQNKLLIKPSSETVTTPTYQNMEIKQGIGYKERISNYTSSNAPVSTQVNTFLGKTFVGDNPAQEIMKMRDRNHFSYVPGEGEITAPILKKGGVHPFISHYLHIKTDATTIVEMVISLSKTPTDPTFNVIIPLLPWQCVKFYRNGTTTGELWMPDYPSTYNPSMKTENLYSTWASSRGGGRHYDMFSNSIKRDPDNMIIPEFITAVCEMDVGITFHSKQSRSVVLPEDTSAEYTAQEEFTIMPARLIELTQDSLDKTIIRFPM